MSWWNKNVENRLHDFKSWTGGFNQPSKVYCRNYIASQKYQNVIDCGCGLATDYFGFKNDGVEINYTGLDSCKYLVELNEKEGIPMIEAELNADLPLEDNSFECVYCREVLEHLPYYEKALTEFVRVASKEVIVVFFIRPVEHYEWKEEINNKIQRIKGEIANQRYKDFLAAHEARLKIIEELPEGEPHPDPIEESKEPLPEIIVTEEDKEINYWKTEDLYHNKYDRDKLENFIRSMPKVDKFFWRSIDDFGYESLPDEEKVASEGLTVKPSSTTTNNKYILHIVLK